MALPFPPSFSSKQANFPQNYSRPTSLSCFPFPSGIHQTANKTQSPFSCLTKRCMTRRTVLYQFSIPSRSRVSSCVRTMAWAVPSAYTLPPLLSHKWSSYYHLLLPLNVSSSGGSGRDPKSNKGSHSLSRLVFVWPFFPADMVLLVYYHSLSHLGCKLEWVESSHALFTPESS